jgi:hypothetical protein
VSRTSSPTGACATRTIPLTVVLTCVPAGAGYGGGHLRYRGQERRGLTTRADHSGIWIRQTRPGRGQTGRSRSGLSDQLSDNASGLGRTRADSSGQWSAGRRGTSGGYERVALPSGRRGKYQRAGLTQQSRSLRRELRIGQQSLGTQCRQFLQFIRNRHRRCRPKGRGRSRCLHEP